MIPGLAVGRFPAAPRPLQVLVPGVLLQGPADLPGHRRAWGEPTAPDLATLIRATSHLVGAGGAEFPTARKLQLLAGEPVGAVVVNAVEGEPASAKDHALMLRSPHLVLDGAASVAHALRVRRVIVRVAAGPLQAAAARAVAERTDLQWSVSVGPDTFVAGEASAVARALRGGPALPDGRAKPPKIGRFVQRAVLLSNAETFARIAVALRGQVSASALVTISGAVQRPGVAELPDRATIGDLLDIAGAVDPVILVTGGWHGAWLAWRPGLADVRLQRSAVREAGGRWGAGVMVVLGRDPHPQLVLEAVAASLAASSAGQCGPCVRGLPAVAEAIAARRDPASLSPLVSGRGLCAHPSAAVAALSSGVAAVRAVGAAPVGVLR